MLTLLILNVGLLYQIFTEFNEGINPSIPAYIYTGHDKPPKINKKEVSDKGIEQVIEKLLQSSKDKKPEDAIKLVDKSCLGCSLRYKEPAKVSLYEIFESEFKLYPDQQYLIIGTKNADQLQKWAEKSLIGIERNFYYEAVGAMRKDVRYVVVNFGSGIYKNDLRIFLVKIDERDIKIVGHIRLP